MKKLSIYISALFMMTNLVKGGGDEFAYIFQPGMEGYQCFRIPAIVKSKNGVILAFAEARKKSCSDTGDIDLVVRRSSDGGITWSKMQVIWDDGENVCGNPAPVVERESGTIFLLMTWNLGSDHEREIIAQTSEDTRRVFVTHSRDNGITWQKPKEITASTKLDNWTWYATGPVHGLQMAYNERFKGRLLIPCDHIEASTKHYYSHIIYSDDKGKTWKLGGSTPQHQVNECTIAELDNGDLLLNMRNYDRNNKNRKVSISEDGGLSWNDIRDDDKLIEPICQGSLLNISARQNGLLFFSNPASTDKRENMTIRMSSDNGASWLKKVVVHEGPSAYSDLVMITEDQIGILYEGGIESPYEGISFEIINISAFK